jgi:DNA-binding response OmpR family regulator
MCSETLPQHIFIVDDSAQLCSTLAQFLRAGGYQVTCFASGLDLIRAFNQPCLPVPTFLLIDCFLPALDGFTLVRWIRSKPFLEQARIVMLSPSGSTLHHLLGRLAGAKDVIAKPTPLTASMLSTLRAVLERLL